MYNPAVHVIDDTFFGSELYLNKGLQHWSSDFELNSVISIKEFRLYTLEEGNPFQTISSSIFTLKNRTKSGMTQKYSIKVIDLISRVEIKRLYGEVLNKNPSCCDTYLKNAFLTHYKGKILRKSRCKLLIEQFTVEISRFPAFLM